MKKHAFIITAYNDFDWIKDSVQYYVKKVDCYIHIDNKIKVPDNFMKWAQSTNGIYIFTRYKINWGSYKHLKAILHMINYARKNNEYDFYHILSANTILTKPLEEVLSYFEANLDSNFLQMTPLEGEYKKLIEPWYIYYHFLHLYDKRTNWGNQFDWYFCKLQKKIGIRRKLDYDYKGLVYSHLNKKFINYVFDYLKEHPRYFANLKTCNIGEELFFQNIISNSPLKDSIVEDNKIFTKWTEGGVAKYLTLEDYEDIDNSDCLFARKYNCNSKELIEKLCSYP